ncbi:hypothetical protein QTP88_008944 [Uroleucon formosanum]
MALIFKLKKQEQNTSVKTIIEKTLAFSSVRFYRGFSPKYSNYLVNFPKLIGNMFKRQSENPSILL